MTYEKSYHAQCRAQQRGIPETDIDFVLEHGTDTGDGILLTNRDVAEHISRIRRQISRLERLKGIAVFTAEGNVVSVYRPKRSKLRRMLKGESRRAATVKTEPPGSNE